MQKIKIRLPATLTNFGGSLHSIGLALNLYTQIEVIPRLDDQLIVETTGEGAGDYALALRHPVVLGMSRIFQMLERAPLGITVRVANDIPLHSGLGSEAAFTVAGIVAANNLMGNPFNRHQLLTHIAQISSQPHSALAAMLGGLVAHHRADNQFAYRTLPITPFQFVLAIPQIDHYEPPALPDVLPTPHVLAQATALALMLEAFREGDLSLLAQTMRTHLNDEALQKRITGYGHVAEVARTAGATAVTTSGGGPAMIFLTGGEPNRLAKGVEEAFENLQIPAIVRVASVDTQGIVMSITQSQT